MVRHRETYSFPGDREVTIGRVADCDIRIVMRQAISRLHAALRLRDGQWIVHDRSRNGTYADGRRIRTLAIGDDVGITLGHPEVTGHPSTVTGIRR